MANDINSFVSSIILKKYPDGDFSNIKARDLLLFKNFLMEQPENLYEAFKNKGVELFDLDAILSRIDSAIVENARLIVKGDDDIKVIRDPVKIDVQELILEKAMKITKGGR